MSQQNLDDKRVIIKLKGKSRPRLLQIVELIEKYYELDPYRNVKFNVNHGEPGYHVFVHLTGETNQ